MSRMYDRVYDKLSNNSALRANDRLLQLAIWRDDGLFLTPEQERKFMEVSNPETIRRERQIIQEQGYFLPSKEVLKARMVRKHQIKEEILIEKSQFINDKITGKAISWLND